MINVFRYSYMNATVRPAITMLTIDMSLIRMLRDGPDVSLNGSPTVSPTIVALWANEPFPPKFPSSIFFLALSQAPPAFAINTASIIALDKAPISRPPRPFSPKRNPTIRGDTTSTIVEEGSFTATERGTATINVVQNYSDYVFGFGTKKFTVRVWDGTVSTVSIVGGGTADNTEPQNPAGHSGGSGN